MLNLAAFRGSNGRVGSWGYWFANGGVASGSSASQMTALGSRPSVFWDARSQAYALVGSDGAFAAQNGDHSYSVWRLTDGANIVSDIAGGNNGAITIFNANTSWDDQLFAINGQDKGNTTNGSPFTKVVVPASITDFSTSRPLLMSLTGGLPRGGGDLVSKAEPGDAFWRAGDQDYYLNYYPKYDGTSKKLLAKDDGLDWYGLQTRTQIDGTQPLTAIVADAPSAVSGYSRVVKNIIYMKLINQVTTLNYHCVFFTLGLRGGRATSPGGIFGHGNLDDSLAHCKLILT